jgi:tight adherence protein C
MTHLWLVTLIFLAPVWCFGIYYLFEGQNLHFRILEESHKAKLTTNDFILFAGGGALIVIMILRGAPLTAIGMLIFSLVILLYYFSGRGARELKSELKKSEAEFPSILAIFSIYISAGLSPAQSLVKIVENGSGVLVTELASAVKEIKAGASATRALENLALQTHSQILRRFIDSLIISMERGTSLNEVLSRQMGEVRGENRSRALEFAAKSEITMMIPIVFLILPVSVLFALWPSYVALGRNIGF